MFLEPKGRNWGRIVNWDDLGKIYAAIIVTWTAILIFGIIWLVRHRQLPFIKFRNLPLAIASTSFLHVYLVKICLAYTTNGHFSCSAEFWIMSIYLPFGIALFQAYLIQLRSLWEQQKRLVSDVHRRAEDIERKTTLVQRWRDLSHVQKSCCVIGLGMTVQLVITVILYATMPTLQGDWSSFGNVSHAKGQYLCRQSLAWIPSAFWQLFWSWMYGPYTLYKVRNIRDIHFWRLQVLVSVIAGLPGTPLWLGALFGPLSAFRLLNRRWVPPMWLAPGIMVMQFVTIFFPILEGWNSKHEMRNTLSMLDEWERHNQSTTSAQSLLLNPPRSSDDSDRTSSSKSAAMSIKTMASLRKALEVNPSPLLEFAATKDFSAENILFLTAVKRWRSAWPAAPRIGTELTAFAHMRLFDMAVNIYATLVDVRTADFPINVESKTKAKLDAVFKSAVVECGRITYSLSPLHLLAPTRAHLDSLSSSGSDSIDPEKMEWEKRGTVVSIEPIFESHPCVQPLETTKASIVPGFDEHVFDEAEKSIEYLVLTNTWQKFVKDRAVERVYEFLVSPQSP